jgi:hypothetical protein
VILSFYTIILIIAGTAAIVSFWCDATICFLNLVILIFYLFKTENPFKKDIALSDLIPGL